MYEKFGQFIDGKWQKSSSGETYDVVNPATEEVIGKASKANSIDVQNAINSASKGLVKFRVGVLGKLQKPGRIIAALGDPKLEGDEGEQQPTWVFQDLPFPSCKFLKEVTISLMEAEPRERLSD